MMLHLCSPTRGTERRNPTPKLCIMRTKKSSISSVLLLATPQIIVVPIEQFATASHRLSLQRGKCSVLLRTHGHQQPYSSRGVPSNNVRSTTSTLPRLNVAVLVNKTGKSYLLIFQQNWKERLAISDHSCGNGAPWSRGRMVNDLPGKACTLYISPFTPLVRQGTQTGTLMIKKKRGR